jgi:hypothetical protein
VIVRSLLKRGSRYEETIVYRKPSFGNGEKFNFKEVVDAEFEEID